MVTRTLTTLLLVGGTTAQTPDHTPDYTIDQRPVVTAMMADVRSEELAKTIKALSGFRTRFFQSRHALESQAWLKSEWERLSAHRDDVAVEYFRHPTLEDPRWRTTDDDPRFTDYTYTMPSLILTIPGNKSPEEIVVIGGHADSEVYKDDPISGDHVIDIYAKAPGADDNASGIASITELLRILMVHDYRPEKTIMLMAYAAEEAGLLGSQDIAQSFTEDKKYVVGTLNLDMTGGIGRSGGIDFVIVDDYTDREQNAFFADLITTYFPHAAWGYSSCTYGCSDHASWNEAGFRSSYVSSFLNKDINPLIHTSEDTFESLGGAGMSDEFARLALAFLVELDK